MKEILLILTAFCFPSCINNRRMNEDFKTVRGWTEKKICLPKGLSCISMEKGSDFTAFTMTGCDSLKCTLPIPDT